MFPAILKVQTYVFEPNKHNGIMSQFMMDREISPLGWKFNKGLGKALSLVEISLNIFILGDIYIRTQ